MIAASWLLTITALGQLLGYWFALPRHIADLTWPTHARFHLIQTVFWITGLYIAILVLIWQPLQRQEEWSFWTLLALVLFAQGSYFFAVAALPKARPPARGNLDEWTLSLVFFISATRLGRNAKILGLLQRRSPTRVPHYISRYEVIGV